MKLKYFKAVKAIRGLDNLCHMAYKKSCKGDWTCLDDINFLDEVGLSFWLHHCLMETFMHNLVAREQLSRCDEVSNSEQE